ncbi:MAG: DUF111 family protein [Candidatus Eisenbacteria bacterium]|nr:DUF111 family protein [Candidatus Eisenbacteria bacterium]
MKIAYLDFWTGLGGDMLVGALLDAGWPEERLFAVVRALKLDRPKSRSNAGPSAG